MIIIRHAQTARPLTRDLLKHTTLQNDSARQLARAIRINLITPGGNVPKGNASITFMRAYDKRVTSPRY